MASVPTRPAALAHDDTGGTGRLVVLLPGAGDLRSEYRFVTDRLAAAGYRVVTADLPGHGDSPAAPHYTVGSTAAALTALIRELEGGPAVVVATSFPPAAAVWVAAEHPELVSGLVAISPHLTDEPSTLQRLVVRATLRGPWAGRLWAKLYSGWYKQAPPADLPTETARLAEMLKDPERRRAVRDTLTADRDGVAARIERLAVPSLTVVGSADDHFPDPAEHARDTAAALGGGMRLVDGAGHYPHVEQPTVVADAIVEFVDGLG